MTVLLPSEVLVLVMHYLDVPDLRALALASHLCHNLVSFVVGAFTSILFVSRSHNMGGPTMPVPNTPIYHRVLRHCSRSSSLLPSPTSVITISRRARGHTRPASRVHYPPHGRESSSRSWLCPLLALSSQLARTFTHTHSSDRQWVMARLVSCPRASTRSRRGAIPAAISLE